MQIYNQIIMSITPNKHKLYEENLGFGFYLGKGLKKVNNKIILYIFSIFFKIKKYIKYWWIGSG